MTGDVREPEGGLVEVEGFRHMAGPKFLFGLEFRRPGRVRGGRQGQEENPIHRPDSTGAGLCR